MERINKTICSLILLFSILLLVGCSTMQNSQEANIHPELTELMQSDSVARRFQETTPNNPTAIESAIELSEKYVGLSDEAAALRLQNKDLIAYNQQIKDKVRTIEAQLQQTQNELTEANEILIEMRIELNNWKRDVIGFRDEMRNAETAQLEALLKILKVLGGEIKTQTAQDGTVGSAVASIGQPG